MWRSCVWLHTIFKIRELFSKYTPILMQMLPLFLCSFNRSWVCRQNSMKVPESFMKILSAFCVFLCADRETHIAKLIDTSLEIFIWNMPQKGWWKWDLQVWILHEAGPCWYAIPYAQVDVPFLNKLWCMLRTFKDVDTACLSGILGSFALEDGTNTACRNFGN